MTRDIFPSFRLSFVHPERVLLVLTRLSFSYGSGEVLDGLIRQMADIAATIAGTPRWPF